MDEHSSQHDVSTYAGPSGLEQSLAFIETLQRDLDALREQLAWSNRLSVLGNMMAVLSHEYNNLLAPIGSYAQLALANPGDAELTQKALRAAAQGVARASRLAEVTLGLASPETPHEAQNCLVSKAISDTQLCVSPMLVREKVTLEVSCEEKEVHIDALSLQQILINLITNACNAMRGQGGNKRISIQGQGSERAYVLRVSDNGPGIPAQIADRLFEPYVTQSAHVEDEQGGERAESTGAMSSGLGLSICKNLLESTGGTIQVQNSSQRGASFEVRLKLGNGSKEQKI